MLPESKKSDTRSGGGGGHGGARGKSSSSSSSSSLPRESFLRQALFNGGCNDVIVLPGGGGGGGASKRAKGNGGRGGGGGGGAAGASAHHHHGTATEAWPQCSVELSGLTVHLPVDHNNPFGRSLRVTVGGLTVRDLVSAVLASPAAASAQAWGQEPGAGGARRASAAGAAAAAAASSSPRKLGVDAAVGTVSAAWARGIPQAAAAAAAAEAQAADAGGVRPAAAGGSGRSRLLPLRRRASDGGRRAAEEAWAAGAGASPELYSVDGEDPVVLDVRTAIAVKVRFIDEGGSPTNTPAAAAAAACAGEGDGRGLSRGASGGGGSGGNIRRNESVFAATGRGRGTADDDLGVAELPPVVIREVRRNSTEKWLSVLEGRGLLLLVFVPPAILSVGWVRTGRTSSWSFVSERNMYTLLSSHDSRL